MLDILGRAANAWTKPHLTNQQRTLDLHLCSLLVFRFFGRSIRDVGALRSTKAVGGILTNQLMDLLANNEVREAFQALIPPGVLKETALSTRALETSFSQIFSNAGSGVKPTQHEIMGVVRKLDAMIPMLRDDKKGFTIRESKRKRKFVEGPDSGWNDGKDDGGKYTADLWKRAKLYTNGKAPTIRTFSQRAGGVG